MDGSTKEKSPAPTLADVARRAGVSTATVSRCLNGSGMLKSETRQIVEAAIAELSYTPNFGARALASNRTGTIGAIIPTMENAIFARGLQVMEETLSEQGITLLVATSDYDPDLELEKLRALVGRGVDGLALIGFERPKESYEFLAARGVPFVLLWNYAADLAYPCAGFDNRLAARRLAEHVLSYGHRSVAMIAGRSEGNDRARARIEGVRDALSAQDLALPPDNLVECAYSFADGEAAAHRLLARPQKPTALICGNDILAVGALRALRSKGLRVPQDISVVGFDDIDLASVVDPPLTTVRTPHGRMGRAGAEMLIKLTGAQPLATKVCFDVDIVERDSLGKVPKS